MAVVSSQFIYLKAIYKIGKEKEVVRNKDIADELSFSKPSVSAALQKLTRDGLVMIEKSGNVILTENGVNLALIAVERNNILYSLFTKLGANDKQARENANIIDCQLTEEMFKLIKNYISV